MLGLSLRCKLCLVLKLSNVFVVVDSSPPLSQTCRLPGWTPVLWDRSHLWAQTPLWTPPPQLDPDITWSHDSFGLYTESVILVYTASTCRIMPNIWNLGPQSHAMVVERPAGWVDKKKNNSTLLQRLIFHRKELQEFNTRQHKRGTRLSSSSSRETLHRETPSEITSIQDCNSRIPDDSLCNWHLDDFPVALLGLVRFPQRGGGKWGRSVQVACNIHPGNSRV